MSGPPRVRSMNVADSDSRPVLVPAGNKARTTDGRKPASKPVKKPEQTIQEPEAKEKKPAVNSNPQCVSVPTILKRQDHHQAVLSFSMNASCSSDASSTDSSTHSRASSSGKVVRRTSEPLKKKNSGPKSERREKVGTDNVAVPDTVLADSIDSLEGKKRCAWVTPNTELEDNVWNEFGENDDHIVPHAVDEHKEQFSIQGDSCKKSYQELHYIKSDDNVSSHNAHDKEELYLMSQKENMLEKNSWSQKPEGVFHSCNADTREEVKRLRALDDTGMSDHCCKSRNMNSSGSEFCADDTILGDKCGAEDDSACQYPINHMSQTDNELSFLDNDGWLDIGNFEDVDQMFRTCDSTFGMGNLNNEEEFCWLLSSHSTEGSDEALTSDFKFSCAEAGPMKIMSEYNIYSKPDVEGPPIADSNKKASSVDRRLRCQMDVDDDAVPGPLSMLNELDMKSGSTDDLRFKDKLQKRLSKASEGRMEDVFLENGDSFCHFSPPTQYEDVKQTNEASSSGVNSHASILKQKRNLNSGGQTEVFLNGPNHTSLLPTSSGSRSDLEGNPSPLKDAHDASLKSNEEGYKLYHSHDALALSKSSENENVVSVAPFSGPGSAQQQLLQFENENEGHSVVGGVGIGFSQEIDSSNVQESSSMSSALEEISLEATSFRQLQQVMDQLDIRTKMCLRDSLYRLAKSAGQRHAYGNTNGSIGDDVEACKSMAQDPRSDCANAQINFGVFGTYLSLFRKISASRDTLGNKRFSRCTGFIDMETDTNPIDRSIAHLLFHRPSDPSRLPLDDTLPFKSNVMRMHGSLTNLAVGTENHKKATNGVDQ